MSKGKNIFSGHRRLWFIVSVLLAPGISTLVISGDHAMANLFHIFSVSNSRIAGEHLFSAWVTFFIFALTDRLGKDEWKIEPEHAKCIFGLILAFYIYHYASHDMMRDGLTNTHNWFTISMTTIGSFFNWLGGCMPDWFYADGWLYLWWFIRTLMWLFFVLLLMFILIPAVMSLPFAILYEIWHDKKDMPSTTYEWFAVLVVYPLFFYSSLWITYHCEFYNGWFPRFLYLASSSLVIWAMAGFRDRCSVCGGSQLNILREVVNRGREKYAGSTIEKGTVYFQGGPDIGTYEKITDHYVRTTYKHTLLECRRCSNKWWDTQTSTSQRNVVTKDQIKT